MKYNKIILTLISVIALVGLLILVFSNMFQQTFLTDETFNFIKDDIIFNYNFSLKSTFNFTNNYVLLGSLSNSESESIVIDNNITNHNNIKIKSVKNRGSIYNTNTQPPSISTYMISKDLNLNINELEYLQIDFDVVNNFRCTDTGIGAGGGLMQIYLVNNNNLIKIFDLPGIMNGQNTNTISRNLTLTSTNINTLFLDSDVNYNIIFFIQTGNSESCAHLGSLSEFDLLINSFVYKKKNISINQTQNITQQNLTNQTNQTVNTTTINITCYKFDEITLAQQVFIKDPETTNCTSVNLTQTFCLKENNQFNNLETCEANRLIEVEDKKDTNWLIWIGIGIFTLILTFIIIYLLKRK